MTPRVLSVRRRRVRVRDSLSRLARSGATGYAAIDQRGDVLAAFPGTAIDNLLPTLWRKTGFWRWIAPRLALHATAAGTILGVAPAGGRELAALMLLACIPLVVAVDLSVRAPRLTYLSHRLATQVPCLKGKVFTLSRIPKEV